MQFLKENAKLSTNRCCDSPRTQQKLKLIQDPEMKFLLKRHIKWLQISIKETDKQNIERKSMWIDAWCSVYLFMSSCCDLFVCLSLTLLCCHAWCVRCVCFCACIVLFWHFKTGIQVCVGWAANLSLLKFRVCRLWFRISQSGMGLEENRSSNAVSRWRGESFVHVFVWKLVDMCVAPCACWCVVSLRTVGLQTLSFHPWC